MPATPNPQELAALLGGSSGYKWSVHADVDMLHDASPCAANGGVMV